MAASDYLEETTVCAAFKLGYDSLKVELSVMAFLRGSDVFVVLPTGFGKIEFLLYLLATCI